MPNYSVPEFKVNWVRTTCSTSLRDLDKETFSEVREHWESFSEKARLPHRSLPTFSDYATTIVKKVSLPLRSLFHPDLEDRRPSIQEEAVLPSSSTTVQILH